MTEGGNVFEMPPQLSNEIIAAAIEGFQAQKKKIDDQIAELRRMLNGGAAEPAATKTSEAPVGKRKKFSASARKRMALAQKARWAKIKGESQSPSPTTPKPPRAERKISADGLKRIAAAQRQRWAVKKAAEAALAKKAAVKKSAAKKTATKKAAPVKKAAAKKSATAVAQAAG
jgi:hypothetical protein